jgi:hypothetical protein
MLTLGFVKIMNGYVKKANITSFCSANHLKAEEIKTAEMMHYPVKL